MSEFFGPNPLARREEKVLGHVLLGPRPERRSKPLVGAKKLMEKRIRGSQHGKGAVCVVFSQ